MNKKSIPLCLMPFIANMMSGKPEEGGEPENPMKKAYHDWLKSADTELNYLLNSISGDTGFESYFRLKSAEANVENVIPEELDEEYQVEQPYSLRLVSATIGGVLADASWTLEAYDGEQVALLIPGEDEPAQGSWVKGNFRYKGNAGVNAWEQFVDALNGANSFEVKINVNIGGEDFLLTWTWHYEPEE